MWDLPRPGLEPVPPALAGGFLTTVPPGKPTKNTIERIHEIRVEVTASVKRYEETALVAKPGLKVVAVTEPSLEAVAVGKPELGTVSGSKMMSVTKPEIAAGTSLVAQWLRICLPMQGTRVQALVREDPTCRGAAKTVHRNY